jgi:hypothetical protein
MSCRCCFRRLVLFDRQIARSVQSKTVAQLLVVTTFGNPSRLGSNQQERFLMRKAFGVKPTEDLNLLWSVRTVPNPQVFAITSNVKSVVDNSRFAHSIRAR